MKYRTKLRIAYVSLAIAIVGSLLFISSVVAVAEPPEGSMRWKQHTVCVEHHRSNDGQYWETKPAVEELDALENIDYVYQRSSCLDAGYYQVIHVYETKILNDDGTCNMSRYAGTTVWDTTNGTDYDGYISRAKIRLNDCMVAGLTTKHKKHINGHELLHAIGLPHTDYCPSLLGPNCGTDGPFLSNHDVNWVREWYTVG